MSLLKPKVRPQEQLRGTQGMTRMRASENIWGFLFIFPTLLGFLVFTLGGVIFSLGMSFTDWNMLRGFDAVNFIGFDNYVRVFNSRDFWTALRNNLQLLLAIPITVILAMILASIINFGVYMRSGIRTLYFLPYVTNVVAVATVWRAIFHPSRGPINMFLHSTLGIPMDYVPGWLSTTSWFIPSIIIIVIWQNLGFNILLFSAGLQNIPKDYYEAAAIDGAGPVKRFIKITLPLLTPVTFLVVILSVIANLQLWTIVQVLTPGGIGFGSASHTISFMIYLQAFVHFNSGFGAAISWVLFFIIFGITLVQWRLQGKWVNY